MVERFFREFDEAFSSFSGEAIARRYLAPYLACRADGSAGCLHDAGAVGEHFQRIVGGYRELGVRSCRSRNLEVTLTDEVHALASVTWELVDARAQMVTTWRETYVLVYHDGHFLARASIDHPSLHGPPGPVPSSESA